MTLQMELQMTKIKVWQEPWLSTHLRGYRTVNTAQLLHSRVAVVTAGGENGHHQLQLGAYLTPDGLKVRLRSIIGYLQHFGIMYLRVSVCVSVCVYTYT